MRRVERVLQPTCRPARKYRMRTSYLFWRVYFGFSLDLIATRIQLCVVLCLCVCPQDGEAACPPSNHASRLAHTSHTHADAPHSHHHHLRTRKRNTHTHTHDPSAPRLFLTRQSPSRPSPAAHAGPTWLAGTPRAGLSGSAPLMAPLADRSSRYALTHESTGRYALTHESTVCGTSRTTWMLGRLGASWMIVCIW